MKTERILKLDFDNYKDNVKSFLEKGLQEDWNLLHLFKRKFPFRFIGILGHLPSEKFLGLLEASCSKHNETGFYYVKEFVVRKDFSIVLEREEYSGWYIPYKDLQKFSKMVFTIFNFMMICPKGDWIIFGMHQGYYLFGSTKRVGEEMLHACPEIIERTYSAFIDDYKSYRDVGIYQWDDWLPKLIKHIYGNEIDLDNY